MPITVPDSARQTSYSPSVPTAAYPVGFVLFDLADVEVYVDGDVVDPADYEVTGTLVDQAYSDAIVTLDIAVSGVDVDIVGARSPRRTDQFQEGGRVPARDLNSAFNRITASVRELWDRRVRAILVPAGEDGIVLPIVADRAGKLFGFDAQGQPIASVLPSELENVAAEAAASAAAADASAEDAEDAAELAERYANENEDVEVEGGLYSARHWAAKSQDTATAAETALDAGIAQAAGYAAAAADSAELLENPDLGFITDAPTDDWDLGTVP